MRRGMTDLNELAQERNHLASERTYLSWVRTSLGILGLGFLILKFIPYHTEAHIEEAKQVGIGLIFLAITLLIFSLITFLRGEISHHRERGSLIASSIMTLVLVASALWLLRIS